MTYLIQAPPYIFAYIATCAISWSSGRYMEHCWHIIGSTVGCIVGVIIMISTLNPGARYFGMFLLCAGPFIGLNVRCTEPHFKKGSALTQGARSIFHGKQRTSLALAQSVVLWLPLPTASHLSPTGSPPTSS